MREGSASVFCLESRGPVGLANTVHLEESKRLLAMLCTRLSLAISFGFMLCVWSVNRGLWASPESLLEMQYLQVPSHSDQMLEHKKQKTKET